MTSDISKASAIGQRNGFYTAIEKRVRCGPSSPLLLFINSTSNNNHISTKPLSSLLQWRRFQSQLQNQTGSNFPKKITANILKRLDTVEILTSARNVCPYWWNICKDTLLWRTIRMSDIHILHYNSSNLSKICCYAVDKSCGGLQDIYIKYFGNDDLLKYVADRYNIFWLFSVLQSKFLILFCC